MYIKDGMERKTDIGSLEKDYTQNMYSSSGGSINMGFYHKRYRKTINIEITKDEVIVKSTPCEKYDICLSRKDKSYICRLAYQLGWNGKVNF